jgi:hypothetical protein
MNYYIDAIEAWKASRSKVRTESKLGGLTNEQLAEILAKMLNRESYTFVRKFIAKEHGVEIKSDSTLSDFYSGVKHFLGPARRRAVLTGVRSTGPLSKDEQLEIDASNRALISERAREVLDNPESDLQETSMMLSALLSVWEGSRKQEDLAIKRSRLRLLEQKTHQAKEKLTDLTRKGGLSKEALKQIEQAAKILS